MRIKTQFIVTMLLFAGILVVAAASAIMTHRQVGKTGKQERIAVSIFQGASELGYLADNYLIYRESQHLKRWQSGFAAFSERVAALDVDKSEQQALVANIRENQNRFKAVFDSVAAAAGRPSAHPGEPLPAALLQVSWSRMAVQSQALAADALRLAQLLNQQMDRLNGTRTVLLYAMVGLFGIFLLTSYLLTYRRILTSIAALRTGAAVIGAGNLDFTIEERKSDEIGELTHAFNRMATDLKALTASKADLEREVGVRRRAEESLAEHAAKLEELNKELESFSYTVSHDLRAPLRAIDGFSQMILRKQGERFDEETRSRFQVIRESVKKMGRLIDDLLDFSRLGWKGVAKETLDMEELIGETWREFVAMNPDREITLKIGQMPAAQGDRSLIRQVCANLVGNAVKFTRDIDAAVIEAGSAVTNGETVYYIRDNGIGFDMQFHDKLFGVFQRLHRDDEYEGTGIGLALVQRIVHHHGGRVWAEGAVNKGACFYFTLPESRIPNGQEIHCPPVV